MSWSLGEIQALTTKAARGAGFPWGVADEAGWAARWLSARGLAGVDAMADALSHRSPTTCALTLGIEIADTGKDAFPLDQEVANPLVILPFIGRAAGDGWIATVTFDDQDVCVTEQDTDLEGSLPLHARLMATCAIGSLPARTRHHRIEKVSDASLQTLTRLAHKTYAPATDASRNSGAGAGLTDND